MFFLLWNLVKQCKLALKKSHNLSQNSSVLSHNLRGKYRTISDFLLRPIRWPVITNFKTEGENYKSSLITVIWKRIATHMSISLNFPFTKPLSEGYCPWNFMLSGCHSQNSLSGCSSHCIGQSFCPKGILPKC